VRMKRSISPENMNSQDSVDIISLISIAAIRVISPPLILEN